MQTLSPLTNIETIYLERSTLFALRYVLCDEMIHVVHFAGFVGSDYRDGNEGLLFDDEQGEPIFVSGDQFAVMLRGIVSLRLVFLDPVVATRQKKASQFHRVAIDLLKGGLPAVTGMQFPIGGVAATRFTETFYNRLAAGDLVDVACIEGRQAVYVRDPESMGWAAPVLYGQVSDGAIFSANPAPVPRLSVFLCHSSSDKDFVRMLYGRLTTDGYDVWLGEEKILPGKAWEPEINRALRNSHVIIVCLSKSSITKAGFVQKEVAIAIDLLQQQPEDSIYLIPAKIEDCGTPERLRHLQFVRIDEEVAINGC
jgi:hypothetical protein